MTVLFQCKLWLLPALFISQSPAHHRVYRDARSRDRERELSKLSGVDVLYMYMFILRDPIGSFSDWQRYGPARAHSGAPLLWFLSLYGMRVLPAMIDFGYRWLWAHLGKLVLLR